MRVIAGRFGGRPLRAPRGATTRPTSDRVREALFSMLGPQLAGARVLDLFAGTGALGIEALSRGAAEAVFVEMDERTRAILRANLEALGLSPQVAQLRPMDASRALVHARQRGETYDLVFVDPPYASASEWEVELAAALPPVLGRGALVAVESDRRSPLRLPLPIRRERRYGDTSLTIHVAED